MYNISRSARELVKHGLFRCGLIDLLDVWRRSRGLKIEHVQRADMSSVFSDIYSNGAWVVDKDRDSLSGPGSANAATADLLLQLSVFLNDVGCRKLVDIGCGDFNWMRNLKGDFDYLGIDIVPQVIAANNAKYDDDRRHFVCMDATVEPISPGDVAVCREVLFHLSFQDGLKLLRNIKAAGFKYVLLTSEKSVWFNSDIRNGDYRHLNLSRPPFRLPKPYAELADDKVSTGRVLAAWTRQVLPG